MGDTIVDSPPPPTLPDVDLAAIGRAGPPAGPPRGSRARREVVLALIVTAVLAAIAGSLLYFFAWRYQATARRHVPGNANVVVRVDLQQVAFFGPVRKHLWPLLFEPAKGAGGKPGKPWAERVNELTGVDFRTDVREALVASVDASGWLVAFGGRLRRGRFVDGMEKLAREQGWPGWHRDGDILAGPGVVLGQADDGTILVGTEPSIVKAALPATDDAARLALPESGAVAFALTKHAWSGLSGMLTTLPHGWILGKVERASGQMTLGDKPEISARIRVTDGTDATALARDLEAMIGELRLVTMLTPDVAGEKAALGAAAVSTDGGEIVVKAPWPYEGLERACEELSHVLR